MGPLVSLEQFQKVGGLVQSGLDDGAEVLAGGRTVDSPGYLVQPTVLSNINKSMAVQRNQIFGPVITVSPFDDVEGVIAQANNSAYGLAAGVDQRHLEGTSGGKDTEGRIGLRQLLPRPQCRHFPRRLQGVRMGRELSQECNRPVHRDKVCLHPAVDAPSGAGSGYRSRSPHCASGAHRAARVAHAPLSSSRWRLTRDGPRHLAFPS